MTVPASGPAAARRSGRTRVPTRLALTTGLVLIVCALLTALTLPGFLAASDRLGRATERTLGTVTAAEGDSAVLTWTPTGGAERVDRVPTAGAPPPPGTRTEIAYDPADPSSPLLPGAAVLAGADRALTTLALVAVVAALVLAVAAGQVLRWRRASARPARRASVRRVRVRSGLVTRSWLEAGDRWIPVHPDPVLAALPSPADVVLRGDPRRDRVVAAEVDGRLLLPSGPVRRTEPRGWRTDNAAAPDAETLARSRTPVPLRRRLLADAPLLLGAPLAALLWTVVDGSGPVAWLGTTALLAALALFWAAVRGADPG